MPKTETAEPEKAPAKPALDARSERIYLYYTGDDEGNPNIPGVPARDLSENDVARLLFIEHGEELHGAAQEKSLAALTERLSEGGLYRRTKPEG